jgi:hypothetical protein
VSNAGMGEHTIVRRAPDRALLYSILIPLLALTIGCGIEVHRFSLERAAVKYDSSYVNSIKYGLLSVDLWKDRIQEIVSGNIGQFNLNPEQQEDLKKVIANVLQALITETDVMLQKRQKSLSGKIKKIIVRSFIDTSDIRKKVPAMTQTIFDEIRKPANSTKLKQLAKSELDEYAAQSYDNDRDLTPVNKILQKYQSATPAEFNEKTKNLIGALNHKATIYSWAMLGSLFLFLVTWWYGRKNPALQNLLYSFAVAFALVFLATALTSPMMEIDARINKVDILLVGKHLEFQDQVLYYRSKSILQVVQTMFHAGGIDSILVGVLILVFSILFPILKLISSEWFLVGDKKIKENPWIHFFAFKSGKWSMADVMVIAIFMAYLGFNGILNNQLTNLNIKTDALEAISTSGTSLQPGFILFVTFVLFGLFLSFMLDRMTANQINARTLVDTP